MTTDNAPMPRTDPMRHLDLKMAEGALRAYNAGKYRGVPNVELDRHGYALLRAGLPNDRANLAKLVRFVGEDYGGAQARFLEVGFAEESDRIADRLLVDLNTYREHLHAIPKITAAVPELRVVEELIVPFYASKRWLVWASKFLHFCRPATFPIMDSRAERFIGFGRSGSPARDYQRFMEQVRDLLQRNGSVVTALRALDAFESPSDLKLLDKVLYEAGAPKAPTTPTQPARASRVTSDGRSSAAAGSGVMIRTKVTNLAGKAARRPTDDRLELCIPKEHWDRFPEHKETFHLEVDGARYTATIGKRDAVAYLYVWTNCTAEDETGVKVTAILQSAGIGAGDTPYLEHLGGHRFRLHTR